MYDADDPSRPQRSSRGGNSASFSQDTASNKLKIENLHYEVSEAELAVRIMRSTAAAAGELRLNELLPDLLVAVLSNGRIGETPFYSSTV